MVRCFSPLQSMVSPQSVLPVCLQLFVFPFFQWRHKRGGDMGVNLLKVPSSSLARTHTVTTDLEVRSRLHLYQCPNENWCWLVRENEPLSARPFWSHTYFKVILGIFVQMSHVALLSKRSLVSIATFWFNKQNGYWSMSSPRINDPGRVDWTHCYW